MVLDRVVARGELRVSAHEPHPAIASRPNSSQRPFLLHEAKGARQRDGCASNSSLSPRVHGRGILETDGIRLPFLHSSQPVGKQSRSQHVRWKGGEYTINSERRLARR